MKLDLNPTMTKAELSDAIQAHAEIDPRFEEVDLRAKKEDILAQVAALLEIDPQMQSLTELSGMPDSDVGVLKSALDQEADKQDEEAEAETEEVGEEEAPPLPELANVFEANTALTTRRSTFAQRKIG